MAEPTTTRAARIRITCRNPDDRGWICGSSGKIG